jgi:excinuclease ABC subunit A
LNSSNEAIIIRGARTHNLKNISCEIPRGKLTVVSGVSGPGKSSLAFDTIHAEGQRRYVESLPAYARQFLERIEKPDVGLIDGLARAASWWCQGPLLPRLEPDGSLLMGQRTHRVLRPDL